MVVTSAPGFGLHQANNENRPAQKFACATTLCFSLARLFMKSQITRKIAAQLEQGVVQKSSCRAVGNRQCTGIRHLTRTGIDNPIWNPFVQLLQVNQAESTRLVQAGSGSRMLEWFAALLRAWKLLKPLARRGSHVAWGTFFVLFWYPGSIWAVSFHLGTPQKPRFFD